MKTTNSFSVITRLFIALTILIVLPSEFAFAKQSKLTKAKGKTIEVWLYENSLLDEKGGIMLLPFLRPLVSFFKLNLYCDNRH